MSLCRRIRPCRRKIDKNFRHIAMNRSRRNNRTGIWVGICVLAVSVVLTGLSWKGPVVLRGALYFFVEPVWNGWNGFREYMGGSTAENKVLMDKVRTLEWELASAERLIEDMKEISEVFVETGVDLTKIPAVRVIKKPPSLPYDVLVLGAGNNISINKGDKILAQGDIVIGEIYDVYEHISTAILYSSPGNSIDVLLGSSALALEARGRGGGVYQIQVPRGVDVSEGDYVAIQSSYPNFLGEIAAVFSEPTDPFKTAIFSMPVNIFEIKWVRVVPGDMELRRIQDEGVILPEISNTSTAATSTDASDI